LQSPKARKLQNVGVELVRLPARHGQLDLKAVLKELGRREILSVLLEAGPTLNGSALAAKAVDKLFLFTRRKSSGAQQSPSCAAAFLRRKFRRSTIANVTLAATSRWKRGSASNSAEQRVARSPSLPFPVNFTRIS